MECFKEIIMSVGVVALLVFSAIITAAATFFLLWLIAKAAQRLGIFRNKDMGE